MAGGKPAWLVNKMRQQMAQNKAKKNTSRAAGGASNTATTGTAGGGAENENRESKSQRGRKQASGGAGTSGSSAAETDRSTTTNEAAVDPAEMDAVLATVSARAPRLAAALLPFQREGVAFVIGKAGRALVAHDMGLGKTLQAIAAMVHYAQEWPCLVVVPASMRWPWVDALEVWLDEALSPGEINVVRDGNNTAINDPRHKVTVVSYPLLNNASILAQVERQRFRVVVADESHYVKDAKAKRTKALLPVLKRATRCVLLSGTPALNRPKDLFTQLDALKPGSFGTFNDFAKRYCDARRLPWGWDCSGGSNLDELHSMLVRGFMHRRLKSSVADQLPPKRRECVRIELSGAAARKMTEANDALGALMEARAAAEAALSRGEGGKRDAADARFEVRKALSAWGKATAEAKAADVAAYVAELIEGGSKLLFFAHHHVMLDAMENALRAARVPHVRIDGKTPSLDRAIAVRRFQEEDALRVAVLSIQACGQGLTLTAAADVVFGELHWVPAAMLQAEDRAHRIGQVNPVNVRYICAAGTLDDIVWPTVKRKLETLGRALDGAKMELGADDTERGVSGFLNPEEELSGAAEEGTVMAALMAHYASRPSQAGNFMAGPRGTLVSAAAGGGMPGRAQGPGGVHARDIRAFFGGGRGGGGEGGRENGKDKAKGPSNEAPDVIDLTAPKPANGRTDDWACAACTLINAGGNARCEVCETPRHSPTHTRPSSTGGPIAGESGSGDGRFRASLPAAFAPQGDGGGGGVYDADADVVRSTRQRASAPAVGGRTEVVDLVDEGEEADAAAGGRRAKKEETSVETKEEEWPSEDLAFEVSGNTGRVFVHRRVIPSTSGDESRASRAATTDRAAFQYAGAQLTAAAFRAANAPGGSTDDLPACLRPPAARRALARFLRQWEDIRPAMRLPLTNRPLQTPLAPLLASLAAGGKKARAVLGSTERFATMERFLHDPASTHEQAAGPRGGAGCEGGDAEAEDEEDGRGGARTFAGEGPREAAVGAGNDRVEDASVSGALPKPPVPGARMVEWRGSTGKLWRQWLAPAAVGGTGDDAASVPLCLACKAAYDDAARAVYGHPFCSEGCLRRYRVLSAPGAAREAIFALERGVCQLCKLDTHALLQALRAEPSVHERARMLEAVGTFGERRVAAVAMNPRAGDLWQADHIVPVSEGGGEADLENYRTLCDPCHAAETAALRARLKAKKRARDAEGTGDIRAFFGGAGGAKKSTT